MIQPSRWKIKAVGIFGESINQKQPVSGGRQKGVHMEENTLPRQMQLSDYAPEPAKSRAAVRTLKIEEDGDSWAGRIKPKIRLKGRWLERSGFKPGNRVRVALVAHGVLELRSNDSATIENNPP